MLGSVSSTHDKLVFMLLCIYLSVSLYFKTKLRTQYVNALVDAKKELV